MRLDGSSEDNDGVLSESDEEVEEEEEEEDNSKLTLKSSQVAIEANSLEVVLLDMMASEDPTTCLEGLSVLAQQAKNKIVRARIGAVLLKMEEMEGGGWLDLLENSLSSSEDDIIRCSAMLCADVLSLKQIGDALMAKISTRPRLVEVLLTLLARPEPCGESYGDLGCVSIEAKRQIARVLCLLSDSYPHMLRTGAALLRSCRSMTDLDPRLSHFTQLALQNLDKA